MEFIPFYLAVSDGANQQKMAELTKKKDKLTSSLAFYEDTFSTYNELLAMLQSKMSLFLNTLDLNI